MFSLIFGDGGKSARKKLLRKNQREITQLIRELDRERLQLQRDENTSIQELKKFAKEQNIQAAKVVAKSIVRNRGAITRLHQLKSQLQAVSLRMAEVHSTQAMTDAMKGTTKALGMMNRKMLHNDAISKILKDFEKQHSILDENSTSLDEAFDDVSSQEEEEAALVGQVFEELKLNDVMFFSSSSAKVPAAAAAQVPEQQGEDDEEEDVLLKRLKHLQGHS
jgi:charged multivesicular body protein 2A